MALSTKKLVLTTGETTTKIEDYVLDLFTFYMSIFPGDIPHTPTMGFDFNLAGITKEKLAGEIKSRLGKLVEQIRSVLPSPNISLDLDSVDLIDEERVRLTLNINGQITDELFIDIYKN